MMCKWHYYPSYRKKSFLSILFVNSKNPIKVAKYYKVKARNIINNFITDKIKCSNKTMLYVNGK